MSSNRQNQLSNLESYIQNVDKEVTLILQSLQWDRKTLSEKSKCHSVVSIKAKEGRLKALGYVADDKLLPEPLDPNADTIVKLCPDNIKQIIETASKNDPQFKKGNGWNEPMPLTLERIQSTYTVDERRAIHDAVVASVPACHDLSDLALLDSNEVKSEAKPKSRTEILAELRDMKRRRTKYRVAAKTKKYSDVLRDVIRTQMEIYTESKTDDAKSEICKNDTSYDDDNRSKFEKGLTKEYPRNRLHDNRDTSDTSSHRNKRRRSTSRDYYESRQKSKRDDDDIEKNYHKNRDKTTGDRSHYKRGDRSKTNFYDKTDDKTKREKRIYDDRDSYKRRSEDERHKRYYPDRNRDDENRRSDHKYSKQHHYQTEKYGSHSREYRKEKSNEKYKQIKIKEEMDDGSYERHRTSYYKSYHYADREREIKQEKDYD